MMIEQGPISEDKFSYIVRCAPLPSLDLIIRDSDRRVLVGFRTNEPAKNYYFVPGGVSARTRALNLFLREFSERKRVAAPASVMHGSLEYFSTFIPLIGSVTRATARTTSLWLTNCNWTTAQQSCWTHSTASPNGWPKPTWSQRVTFTRTPKPTSAGNRQSERRHHLAAGRPSHRGQPTDAVRLGGAAHYRAVLFVPVKGA
jgi:hypothetical protein